MGSVVGLSVAANDDPSTTFILAVVVVLALTLPLVITVVFFKVESMHTDFELAPVPAIEIEKELFIPNSKSITVHSENSAERSRLEI